MRYIDARRGRWGVEPICRALQFAPSTYYATKDRPASARAVRDEALKPEILRVHESNCDGVYGAKKIWKQLHREGITVADCTVRRLMKEEGLSGARRGRQFKVTTIVDEHQHHPSDLVDRQFVAVAPNRLWVADLTYVKTAGIQGHREVALDEVFVGRDVDQISMPLLRTGQANEALLVHDSANQLLVHHESALVPQRSSDAANAVSGA